jgi:hypothetical protein
MKACKSRKICGLFLFEKPTDTSGTICTRKLVNILQAEKATR